MLILPEFIAEWADVKKTMFYDSACVKGPRVWLIRRHPGPSFRLQRLLLTVLLLFLLVSFYSYFFTCILILCRCVLSFCVINEYVCMYVCWILWRHEYDVTHVKSFDVIDDAINRRFSIGIGHEPLNRLVSEIFSIKVADTQTHKQTDRQTGTSTDNRGRLKLAARKPIKTTQWIHDQYKCCL